MLEWLAAHDGAANTVINLGMLLVWVVYLHVFVSSYRRQKRANILISIGAGTGLQARCLVSNLSQSPIYVRSILLDVKTAAGAISLSVTELEELERWERPSELDLWTRQGPLQPGSVRDLGTFASMLDHAISKIDDAPFPAADDVETFRLTVICNYGPEDLLVAATQGYSVERSVSKPRVRPDTPSPRQITSRRERAHIKARLERALQQA